MNLTECPICKECFSIAIAVELSARRFYLRMEELFRHDPVLSEMLLLMANDEADHASTLEKVRATGSHPPNIHENAPRYTMSLIKLLGHIGEQISREHLNFDEAWQFALDFERSEVNHIYLSLTSPSMINPEDGDLYVASILKVHVQRLVNMGERYDKAKRQSILPKLAATS